MPALLSFTFSHFTFILPAIFSPSFVFKSCTGATLPPLRIRSAASGSFYISFCFIICPVLHFLLLSVYFIQKQKINVFCFKFSKICHIIAPSFKDFFQVLKVALVQLCRRFGSVPPHQEAFIIFFCLCSPAKILQVVCFLRFLHTVNYGLARAFCFLSFAVPLPDPSTSCAPVC